MSTKQYYVSGIFKCVTQMQVTQEMIKYLTKKRLTKVDLAPNEDGTSSRWRFATRVVTSNKEVDCINLKQLIRFAKDHGKIVFFWYVETTGSSGNAARAEVSTGEIAENVRGMIQYFVEGAQCMVTKNTYMKHGVANGTRGAMHSLTWEDARDFPGKLRNCVPGDLVQVHQPYSVNVSIPLKSANEFSTPDGDRGFSMIVPIVREAVSFTVVKYNRKTRKRGVKLRCYSHNVAPTFAMTFHKSQGQTLPLVVLHLHKHVGRALKGLQFEGLYVALSRVEFGSHIRVVFDDETGLKHLRNLKRPGNFGLWINNYCGQTGKWIPAGMDKLHKTKVQTALGKLRRVKKLECLTKRALVDLARILDVEVNKNATGASNKQEYINALYDSWVAQRGNNPSSVHRGSHSRESGNIKKNKPRRVVRGSKGRGKTPITPEKRLIRPRSKIITPSKIHYMTSNLDDSEVTIVRETNKRNLPKSKRRLVFTQSKQMQVSGTFSVRSQNSRIYQWTKVHGDGFCWVYAFLIATGLLTHNDFPNGDDGTYAPTDKAIKASRALAPYAFKDSPYNFPEFANGLCTGMGTYGGYRHYKNILNRMRPGFRFFVLDSTRQWIDCAIVVRNDRIHHTGPRRVPNIVEERETKITDFCENTQDFPNLLCYEHWSYDTTPRVKMIFDQTVVQRNEKWVKYHDSDVVVCWARADHFNALARVDGAEKTTKVFVQTAVHDPHKNARLFPS